MHTKEKEQTESRAAAQLVPTVRLLFAVPKGATQEDSRGLTAGIDLEIGRATRSGLRLMDDPCVSERHAILRYDDARHSVSILDAKSRNGTFVNGQRITATVLSDGDLIRVGDSLLLLRYEAEDMADAHIEELVGDAPVLREVRGKLQRLAASLASVLIQGETGTGKELAASALHRLSGRSGRFVAVNCATINPDLAESQIFGHAPGAFTGAKQGHDGFFVQAEQGTLFLDEVGELPLPLQAKLLRVLEDKRVTPLGSHVTRKVDVRVVAATNRHIGAVGLQDSFRQDLYARLGEVELTMPPLCQRREDVLRLFVLGLQRLQTRDRLARLPALSTELAETLVLHRWPRNVRELFGLSARFGLGMLTAAELARSLREETSDDSEQFGSQAEGGMEPRPITPELLESLLHKHRGHITHIAKELNLSRRQIGRWCERLGLVPRSYKGGSEDAPDDSEEA